MFWKVNVKNIMIWKNNFVVKVITINNYLRYLVTGKYSLW